MDYKLQDLIDISLIQTLQDKLNEIYSFPSAIIDNEGNILTATAWQDICTKFHRIHPQSQKECIISDQYILDHLPEANPTVSYRCPHGMIDNATPIIIGGKHVGNFFTGQMFLEKPDMDFFTTQALKYGFDVPEYLRAVSKVPVWSKEQLDKYIDIIKTFTTILAEMGYKNLNEKEAKKIIEQKEEIHHEIIHTSLDGFWRSDIKGKFLDVNQAYCDIIGYSKEEILSMSIPDVEAVETYDKTLVHIQQLIQLRKLNFESKHRCKSGKIIDVRISATYSSSQDGQIFVFINDITERKLAEKKLIEKENQLRAIVEGTPHLFFYSQDANALINYISPSVEAITGYSVDEWLNQSHWFITQNKINDIAKQKTHAHLRGDLSEGPIIVEIEHKEKYPILLEIYESPVFLNGELVGLQGVAHNVTRQKQSEEKILQLSRAVEQSPVSIVITNLDGTIEYANPKVFETSGYSPQELIGKNPRVFSSGETPKEDYKILWDTITAGIEWIGVFHNKKKNGNLYWESALISPIKDDSGKFTHYLAVKEDVTEKKLIYDELINAKEFAEKSNKLKDAFMANISHEIRTPLNGIVGMASIIKDIFSSQITKAEEKYFKAITLSSNRITRTIDMILNFSQLQIGNFSMQPKLINLTAIIDENLRKFNVIAQSKSVELIFNNNIGKTEIFADEYCIDFAVSNLIDNAVKFTDSGTVTLTLGEDINENLYLDIKDSGIGISPEYLQNLYNPYSQEDIGYGRSYEGVGLGLSLVKEFLRLNNADISVSSPKGIGSVFTIHFNKKKSIQVTQNIEKENIQMESIPDADTSAIKLTILVVEDDAINQLYLKSKLKKDYEVIIASSAKKALEKLKSISVDIILMDISLQDGMNGIELTKHLKTDEKYSKIKIIAVTGHASNEDRNRILSAGCDDYLAKPFQIDELLNKIKIHS